ncbi:sodium-independent sulfate anion transporter-like [Tribolium madens]|uniref:sodium-independent sulfate anion transporter-like n=1 Tax=Tribolium madens TaxID=41895 RepID=UPI001CF76049|nr:sodium-independent sulfate anion transporter-like [Tribolium madens]
MFINWPEIVKRGFPVLTWGKNYSLDVAIADLVAGITIGLTLIPQCIAYASLAGLGPEYGLYSSLCGGIIYVVFGAVPELNIAPTALLSLLTFTFTNNASFGKVKAAILLCFLSGIIELFCGSLHLGFLVDFVSTPVVAAFTSAGALTIATSQIKNLLGLNFSADSFVGVWSKVFGHITETKMWDAILGIGCCVVLLLLRKLKDYGSPPLDDHKVVSRGKKVIWFCSVARNAFVVIACAATAYLFDSRGEKPFSLTSKVPEGLPSFTNPVAEVQHGNTTTSVVDMMKELGAGIFAVPFVAILGNVAIAKAFAKGKVIDASQEMIAVGMCNLIGSFFGSYPVNASFSRAAVSNASGVRTPLAGIYTGVMVILALTFLTPYFSYIPKPTLAAVIICAVIFMVEVTLTKLIWRINKIDLVPFFVTLVFCLVLGIEFGILIGVCVDILFLLYRTARPKVVFDYIHNENQTNYVKITPTSAILFPSVEYIREKIMQNSEIQNVKYTFLVFDCQRVNKLDFTAAKSLSALLSDLSKMQKQVIFYRSQKAVVKIMTKVTEGGVKIAETEENLYEILQEHDKTRRENTVISVEEKENNTTL